MRIGTSHFTSVFSAARYYGLESRAEVMAKVAAGEISIGAPAIQSGQKLGIIKSEGRYEIIEEAA